MPASLNFTLIIQGQTGHLESWETFVPLVATAALKWKEEINKLINGLLCLTILIQTGTLGPQRCLCSEVINVFHPGSHSFLCCKPDSEIDSNSSFKYRNIHMDFFLSFFLL